MIHGQSFYGKDVFWNGCYLTTVVMSLAEAKERSLGVGSDIKFVNPWEYCSLYNS
ncbi:MAG: hypothetical protein HWQ23_22345 [Nostoc sp. JL33]|nr:hypothetical protein [Nostoc sp. JL33]